jgi:hypothetical protein
MAPSASSCPCVGLGSLASHGQPSLVSQTPVRTDIDQPFYILSHFLSQVALYFLSFLDNFSDFLDLFFGIPKI